jgi:hypothetical protein
LTITPKEGIALLAACRITALMAAESFRAAEAEYGKKAVAHFGARDGSAVADLCDQVADIAMAQGEPP